MRYFVAALLGAATLVTALPASAETRPLRALPNVEKAYPNETYAQYWRRRYPPPPPYYYYRRPRDNGAAVAAGVAGVAAGALIAGAIANQAQAQPPAPPGTVNPTVAAYCARKYKSYDPVTRTYLAYNGMRYVCTYP